MVAIGLTVAEDAHTAKEVDLSPYFFFPLTKRREWEKNTEISRRTSKWVTPNFELAHERDELDAQLREKVFLWHGLVFPVVPGVRRSH